MLTKTFNDLEIFKNRRNQLAKLAPNSVFVLFSGEESHLGRFRAESSFVYLTGFEEPDSVAVICTCGEAKLHLFVRDKNPAIEIWDGERFGVAKAKAEFHAEETYSIDSLEDHLAGLFAGCDNIYFDLGEQGLEDSVVLSARQQVKQLKRRSGGSLQPILDPLSVLSKMRVKKDALEIQLMRDSCELTAKAHIAVMKVVKPGMNERQVQSSLFGAFYDQMAFQEAYSSIIASGANACTLHYRANNRQMQDGDFLLIDAGAEKSYYCADITRTYPINAKFSLAQKDLYEAVLETQKKLIELAKPGFSLPELHDSSVQLLTQNMVDLNLLKGSVDQLIETKAYQKYYPHGVGHYLGMDVHDVGLSKIGDKPVAFEAGMIHTVEPGIYVPEDDELAPSELRGLGVRIEDDILITDSGNENLTALAPKEVSELEAIVGS